MGFLCDIGYGSVKPISWVHVTNCVWFLALDFRGWCGLQFPPVNLGLVTMLFEDVIRVLRAGGWALLRFNARGWGLGYKTANYGSIPDPNTAYGYTPVVSSKLRPTTEEIFLMDTAQQWLQLVPSEVDRRALSLRLLYNADTDRYLYSFRQIGDQLGIPPDEARESVARATRAIWYEMRRRSNLAVINKIMLYIHACPAA